MVTGPAGSRLADLAASHPPPAERARRIAQRLQGRVSPAVGHAAPRVNREVFRRAAGREVLWGPLDPAEIVDRRRAEAAARTLHRRLRGLAWGAAGAVLLGGLLLLVAWLLSR